ncbi:MAG: YkgJ family cysteine cluster protein [Vampirovibrionales bacterium]|nr:YkgJ family cysteine cluster protein [Vampirovibrionales bacterium]
MPSHVTTTRHWKTTVAQYQHEMAWVSQRLADVLKQAWNNDGEFSGSAPFLGVDSSPQWMKETLQRCDGSPFHRQWLEKCLNILKNTLPQAVLGQLAEIESERSAIACHQCGVCCRLASQDEDYETLLAKASGGDTFAQEFTRVFLPYETRQHAENRFPELVAALQAEVGEERPLHFYHCPYVGQDNRCTVYGTAKRPAFCGTYPETPLSAIQPNCAWKPWQGEQHTITLQCHATLVLCEAWHEHISETLSC